MTCSDKGYAPSASPAAWVSAMMPATSSESRWLRRSTTCSSERSLPTPVRLDRAGVGSAASGQVPLRCRYRRRRTGRDDLLGVGQSAVGRRDELVPDLADRA